MANIMEVAKYILHKQGEMSTMKLEKLCYYCQAWHLVWEEVPLFEEDFQAWANGPVCPQLFYLHKNIFKINENILSQFSIDSLKDNEKESIDIVIKEYGEKAGYWLSELTHKERPWKETRNGIPKGERCSRVISKNLIQEYYSGLQ